MDPRAALLQQESDENGRFKNSSIGMHNLRAKLREQLKGYTHIRGKSARDFGKQDSCSFRFQAVAAWCKRGLH